MPSPKTKGRSQPTHGRAYSRATRSGFKDNASPLHLRRCYLHVVFVPYKGVVSSDRTRNRIEPHAVAKDRHNPKQGIRYRKQTQNSNYQVANRKESEVRSFGIFPNILS